MAGDGLPFGSVGSGGSADSFIHFQVLLSSIDDGNTLHTLIRNLLPVDMFNYFVRYSIKIFFFTLSASSFEKFFCEHSVRIPKAHGAHWWAIFGTKLAR